MPNKVIFEFTCKYTNNSFKLTKGDKYILSINLAGSVRTFETLDEAVNFCQRYNNA